MKKIIIITALITSSCTSFSPIWPTGELYPYTTESGEHRFRYVGLNILHPMFEGETTIDEIHRNQISGKLGQQRYCQKGYEITSVKEIEKTDNIVYEGICK